MGEFNMTFEQLIENKQKILSGYEKKGWVKPMSKEKEYYDYLYAKIENALACLHLKLYENDARRVMTLAILGNLKAESNLNPKNLQNTFEKKLGFTDETYTQSVDNCDYGAFITDSAGYGLAQWTYWSRKRDLLQYARECRTSIGDPYMQLDFLCIELKTKYQGVLKAMYNCTTIREASDIFLKNFERPANQSESVCQYRARLGEEIGVIVDGDKGTYETSRKEYDELHESKDTEYYCLTGYTGRSIVDALKLIGEDSSLAFRRKLAAYNNCRFTSDTYRMNVWLLSQLKEGKLMKIK